MTKKHTTHPILVSSQDKIENYKIVKTHGVVMGNTVRARHIGSDFVASLRKLVGGEVKSYTILVAQAREEALDRLMKEAAKVGANALVAVRVSTTTLLAGTLEILVYGTAVTIELENQEK